jgi:hypothetical protein
MKIMPFLCCLLLCLFSRLSWADDGKAGDGFLGLQSDPNPFSSQHILEFWGYHNYQGSADYSDTLKLRYYQPVQLDGWHGTIRLDTSYVSNYGPSDPNQTYGSYSAGNTLLTVWGNHPGFLENWGGTLGGRIIFPFGNNGQWALGPHVGQVFQSTQGSRALLSDFSPLMRYLYGFAANGTPIANQPPLLRRLDLYPTLGFNITPNTQIRFWDENGINYNTAGGGWFVPIDAMVTHRVNKDFLVALGASKQLVQTYPEYNWSVYGKLSYNF